jgi:hypothetical protein
MEGELLNIADFSVNFIIFQFKNSKEKTEILSTNKSRCNHTTKVFPSLPLIFHHKKCNSLTGNKKKNQQYIFLKFQQFSRFVKKNHEIYLGNC